MASEGTLLDPVCDMVVNVDDARDHGLTLEMPDREYAFCAAGCQTTFARAPQRYTAKVDAWLAARAAGIRADEPGHELEAAGDPAIDHGMREWYRSCRCCMSEAYPNIVEQLDAENAQAPGH